MIPTYQLTGESVDILGKGTVFTASLTCDCDRQELSQLLGQLINNQIIIGIESFAIPNQTKGMGIGLLVQKEKKMGKEKFTVSWIMADEPLLKLKEPDETYDIAKDVFKFIQENKLHEKEDFQVEVEIDKNQGDNGTVTYLKEVGGSAPTETPKEEAKTDTSNSQSEDLIVKELTVSGVSVAEKGVIFKEEEKVWYTLDDSINAQEFKDKYTRKTVEVSIRQTDEGNDVITAFTVKEEDTSSKDTKNSGTSQQKSKFNGNMIQKSIEAQASMNSACRVAQAILTKDSLPENAEKIIKRISEYNFQMIQDLKNKE